MVRTSLDLRQSRSAASPDELPFERTEDISALALLPRVGIIRNARSHRNKGNECDYLDDPNVISATPTTKAELAVALARFARENIGLLVIDGGDGTVRDVLTRAMPVFREGWPPIIVLPRGKTNALAYNLGLPRHWSLDDALNTALRGRALVRRPLVIERLDAPGRDRVGFLLGAGVFNAAIKAGQTAHRAGAFESMAVGVTTAFGVLQAMLGFGGSAWRSLSPMRIRTGAETQELPQMDGVPAGERFFIMASSLAHFPFGMKPFPKLMNNNSLNYLVYDKPLRRAVAAFPALMFGFDPENPGKIGIHRGVSTQLDVEFGDSFILDGETYPAGSYRVKLGPELHFIAP